MWEFCVVANLKNKHLLEILSENLKQKICEVGGIQTFSNTAKNSVLILACPKEKAKLFQTKLKIELSSVISKHMKFDYLKSHLFFSALNDVLLKVFTYFDLELENALTLKMLELKSNLNLESFLEFRLSFLKKKWQELCRLLSNEKILGKQENLNELLKFLLTSLEPKENALVLDFKLNLIFVENGNSCTKIANISTNTLNTLEIVIENFPKTLKIIKSPNNLPAQTFFQSIFEQNLKVF